MSSICIAVSANTRDDVLAHAKKFLQSGNIQARFTKCLENFKQVSITDEQADFVIDKMDYLADEIKTNKGTSSDKQTAAEQELFMDSYDEICEELKTAYETTIKSGTIDDTVFTFYYNDRKLGDVDLDAVKTTGGAEEVEDEYSAVTAVASIAAAVAVLFVCLNK